MESEIKKYPIEKYGMVPNHSFLQEMSSCSVATIPEGFYNNADKGSIIMKRSPSFSFFKEGVVLDDSIGPTEHIKSDLVIYATGFKGDQKLKNIFESPKFQDLITGSYNEIVPLYRFCASNFSFPVFFLCKLLIFIN